MNGVRADLRYALRQLLQRPRLTIVVAGVLATGIGMTTALFSVFSAVVLQPWPVAAPDSVVRIYSTGWPAPVASRGFSLPEYRYLADHASTFTGIVAIDSIAPCGKELRCQHVSWNYFNVLEVAIERGRAFGDAQEEVTNPAVAVLSHHAWQVRFGGDPSIVGRTVTIYGAPFVVVGVASRAFTGTPTANRLRADVWLPFAALSVEQPGAQPSLGRAKDAGRFDTWVAGRLAANVDTTRARTELIQLSRQFRTSAGLEIRGVALTGTALLDSPKDRQLAWPMISLMFGAVLLVLLIACANVGNVLLSRGIGRRDEMALRLSLGATRGRLVQQLLLESLVLAIASATLGVAVATTVTPPLIRTFAPSMSVDLGLDGNVLVVAVGLALLSSIASGLAPALHCTRSAMGRALHTRGTGASTSPRLRQGLLVVQMALCVLLLSSAALLLDAVRQLGRQDPGFPVGDIIVMSFALDEDAPRSGEATADVVRRIETELAALPGAPTVGLAMTLPFEGARTLAGHPGGESSRRQAVAVQEITADYLNVLGIRLLAGRSFTQADHGTPVVLVNESLARLYWPGRSALGQSLVVRRTQCEVVGVVSDVRTAALDRVEPGLYQPFNYQSLPKVVMRTPSRDMRAAMVAATRRADPALGATFMPLSANVAQWLRAPTIAARAAGALGLVALALATLGLFGAFDYAVEQRTRELGVRIALGAQRRDIVALVLRSNTPIVLIGTGSGLALAVAASLGLRSYLYGLNPLSPATHLGVAVLLGCTALLAAVVPTRRATLIQPVLALRQE